MIDDRCMYVYMHIYYFFAGMYMFINYVYVYVDAQCIYNVDVYVDAQCIYMYVDVYVCMYTLVCRCICISQQKKDVFPDVIPLHLYHVQ